MHNRHATQSNNTQIKYSVCGVIYDYSSSPVVQYVESQATFRLFQNTYEPYVWTKINCALTLENLIHMLTVTLADQAPTLAKTAGIS